MPTKEFGLTKSAWPHMWLRSAMVEKTKSSRGTRPPTKKLSPLAADAKTPSHESSSRAVARLESPLWPRFKFHDYPRPDYASLPKAVVALNSST